MAPPVPRPDSFQALGHYIELCRFFGWDDALDVLLRRAAASPEGERTRCLTPHAAMLEAVFAAQLKASAARLPPPAPVPEDGAAEEPEA